MKNNKLVSKATIMASKATFKLRKHSPEILLVSGIVGVVGSAVMACKATTKLSTILEETKDTVDKIHEVSADEKMVDKYTEEDAKKDLLITYVQMGLKIGKLYAPSIIIGGLSITAILASNNILRRRNVALAAAYATVDKSFKEYRGRVVERFGKEVDHQLKNNIKVNTIKEESVDSETGEVKVTEKTVAATEYDGISDYARFFDDGCLGWEKDPEMNLMFLKRQQRYANDLLIARGHVFLNEVYDMLGIPRSKAGQVVGWVYDPKNATGDNYIDFGIYNETRTANRDFVNGYERTILLDFNVDGNIWELMK